jgi:hypothetical protein
MALKLGTENKNKTYAAIGLLIVTFLVAVYVIHDQFFSTPSVPTPTPIAAAPSPRRPAAAGPASSPTSPDGGAPAAPFAHQAVSLPSASALDPTLHPELMAQAEATTYTGDGRNIFSPNSAPAARNIEAPKVPIRPAGPVVQQGPPPPPPPPNIDLKFYAYYAPHEGGQKKVCLLHGEDIFIAAEGDTVDRRYKVVKINPFSVDVEDLAYSHTQSLPLTQN